MVRLGYRRRFEAFLREVREESLSLSREGELPGDLQQVSIRSQLVSWEFRHSVDAMQLGLVDVAQVPAGKATVRFTAGHRTLSATGSRMNVEPRRAAARR
jgi:hypothetical protein